MRSSSALRSARLLAVPSLLATLASAACASAPQAERVEIRTTGLSLTHAGDGAIKTYDFKLKTRTQQVAETGMGLSILGQVDAPVVDGITLQATDVLWKGDFVYASYNVRGDVFLGALQVIDVRDPKNPHVTSEAVYRGTDLARIQVQGNRILAAGADQNEGGTLELFTLGTGGVLGFDGFEKTGSFSATFLDLHGNLAYVSYGDKDGGLAVFDVRDPKPALQSRQGVADARWVQHDAKGTLYLAGTPARLGRLGGAEVGVDGAAVGAPTWATLDHDNLYVSADNAGLLVYDVRTMTKVGQLPTTGNANGAAITPDGRIAFLANGEEGLVVADVVDPANPTKVASIDITDDKGSANAVALSGNHIALADGLGGVKLLEYSRTVTTPSDCDGDGVPDDLDPDDDDDGVLDEDDAARCDPTQWCPPGHYDYEARFVGDFFNLPCDHKDVEGRVTGVVRGTKPSDFDWFDKKYYVFSVERDSLVIKYSENYFPVDTGLCGDPFYFAAHWATMATATEAGKYRFELGTDDDGWLFVDGKMVSDLGGIHAIVRESAEVDLTAGAHRFDIYFAERHVVQSGLEFEAVGFPTSTAKIRFTQHKCLDPLGDEDGDGIPNGVDIAPLQPR